MRNPLTDWIDLQNILKYGMLKRKRGLTDMPRKNARNTKGRIISAAWRLFYEQGY